MERRFACTACGKCCYGWLPLTLKDALEHAGRFPLAVVWTPVRQASKAFDLTSRIGLTLRTRDKKNLAVRIVPTGYMPPTMACPALTGDNLCDIHADKPSRCRTMPFFPYRDEADQADLLVPRPGWTCDVSENAPVVYRDKAIQTPGDFEAERAELLAQAATLRAYGQWLLGRVPGMVEHLAKVSLKPGGGHVAVSFASLLRRLADVDQAAVATRQLAILSDFAQKVADQPKLAEYQKNYADWAWELEGLAGG